MGDDSLDSYPDTPLKLAMKDRGVSIRALAKRMEPDADTKRLDNLRKQIRGWLGGGQPQGDNAARLARALELPENYFVKPRPARAGGAQEAMEAIEELRRRQEQFEALVREQLAGIRPTRSASSPRPRR